MINNGAMQCRQLDVMNHRIHDGGLSLLLRTDLMISRSTTERDNRHHDRCPRDIDRGVPISVISIAARDTTESGLTLAVRFCTVATRATRTRRVAGINGMQWYASKSRLVGKELTELSKGPGSMAIALRTSNRAIGSFPNVPKFFNRYSLSSGFGFLNNPFGDDMIGVFAEPGFFARELLEMAFRTLCPPLLQALAQGMMALARLLNGFSAKCLAFTIGGKVDNAQIHAKRSIRSTRSRGGNIQRHSQREGPVAVEQIGLPLDAPHPGRLIASDQERHEYTARKRQEGDGSQALKGHDSFIVDKSAFRLKGRLDALIALVGFTGLADASDSQLSSKLVGSTQLTIDHLLQFKRIGSLFRKSDFCHIGSCLVKGVHGVKQSLMLFSGWVKLQEHRLFHAPSIHPLMKAVSRHGTFCLRAAFFPLRLKRTGLPERTFC